jgi:hypothetical protein
MSILKQKSSLLLIVLILSALLVPLFAYLVSMNNAINKQIIFAIYTNNEGIGNLEIYLQNNKPLFKIKTQKQDVVTKDCAELRSQTNSSFQTGKYESIKFYKLNTNQNEVKKIECEELNNYSYKELEKGYNINNYAKYDVANKEFKFIDIVGYSYITDNNVYLEHNNKSYKFSLPDYSSSYPRFITIGETK